MIDLHSHILPGVDDGARDWEEALELCRIAQEAGISHLVATPHFIPGAYTRGVKEGPRLLEELKERIQARGIHLELSLGAEIEPFPELIQWLERGRLPLYPSGRHLLIEAPLYSSPPWLEDLLRDLITTGITPVIAHPERSPLAANPALSRLVEAGAEIQLDAASLLGIWGREIQKKAREMIDRGWVSYVASDSHRKEGRTPRLLEEARKLLALEKGEALARALTRDLPARVITPWCSQGTQ